MSYLAARVFRSLLAPASRAATSSSRSASTVAAGGTKKSAAKPKAKPKPKSKPDSLAKKKTPRTTGIFKATTVSPALAQFLGTGETTRTDAVKEVWTYVKSHDLQVHSYLLFSAFCVCKVWILHVEEN